MPKRGPEVKEPFSPIDARLTDELFRPRQQATPVKEPETPPNNGVSIPKKRGGVQRNDTALASSAMNAGWKISTTPEDKQAIIVFLQQLNAELGGFSNLGISNLGRALYMMAVKRKDEIFKVCRGRELVRPDNNDHAALALLEEELGDLIAEACFDSVREMKREG